MLHNKLMHKRSQASLLISTGGERHLAVAPRKYDCSCDAMGRLMRMSKEEIADAELKGQSSRVI